MQAVRVVDFLCPLSSNQPVERDFLANLCIIAWKLHFSGYGKGAFKAPPTHAGDNLGLGQIEVLLRKRKASGAMAH